jgi:hypothetical protein
MATFAGPKFLREMNNGEEILNIQYWARELCVRALNKYPSKVKAAKALGITVRNLYQLMEVHNIVRETPFGGNYFIAQRISKLKIA